MGSMVIQRLRNGAIDKSVGNAQFRERSIATNDNARSERKTECTSTGKIFTAEASRRVSSEVRGVPDFVLDARNSLRAEFLFIRPRSRYVTPAVLVEARDW